MTPREQALLGYFYAVATDPRVRAAGFSPRPLRDAVLACVAEDLGGVVAIAVRGAAAKAEPVVAGATRGVAETVLGGTVSPKAAEELSAGLETMVRDGFRWLGGMITKAEARAKGGKK